MHIIIEIPESDIPKGQDIIEIPLHFMDGKICEVGGYGFDVLPKGHGKLIDADAVIAEATERMKYPANYKYMECVIAHMKLAPTVVEADKENEEYDASNS